MDLKRLGAGLELRDSTIFREISLLLLVCRMVGKKGLFCQCVSVACVL